MNDPSRYRDDFLRDMAPELAERYRYWFPHIRTTVLEWVDRLAERSTLERMLGQPLSDTAFQVAREAWYEPFRSYLTRSGKMIRPYLVCFCMEAYGREPRSAPGALAIAEIIHSASLILDDIADDSPLRRGAPTAHRRVGMRVAGASASAWLNSCFALFDDEAFGLDGPAKIRLAEEIAWEHWVTGLGTTIDTAWPWLERFDRTADQYMQSVVHRSTSYTYRLPLKIGAIAAGAAEGEFKQLAAYGEELGLAFQIVDDILNVSPEDEHWGKAVAEDITQGKVTLQVMLALERASAGARARLVEILGSRTDDPLVLAEAVGIMAESGTFERAREIADTHIERAKRMVRAMTFLAAKDRGRLESLVDYVVKRSR